MRSSNYHNYANHIENGLTLGNYGFNLNQRSIVLYSGSMQYYRVPEPYWRDRLRKMRNAGLNTVETNIPWNLHEPELGFYEFGYSHTEYARLLNVASFLKTAQEEDLFAVVRIGSVVDYGLDNGGVPSWSTRNNSKIGFLGHLQRYIAMIFLILGHLQFSNKGPIIGFYITDDVSSNELEDIAKLAGLKEFVFNDKKLREHSICPGIVPADDFDIYVHGKFNSRGYSDFRVHQEKLWSNNNIITSKDEIIIDIAVVVEKIVYINFFAFTGGTTFGLLNGAAPHGNAFFPNSFDFGSPISESGVCRYKYYIITSAITGRNNTRRMETSLNFTGVPYGHVSNQLLLKKILDEHLLSSFKSKSLIPMSNLPINRNCGQAYGFLVYRKLSLFLPTNSKIMINDSIHDNLILMINGVVKSLPKDYTIDTGHKEIPNATLDIIYENRGRSPKTQQFKGLWDNSVTLNDKKIANWLIYPLDFRDGWSKNLTAWRKPILQRNRPGFYKIVFEIDSPQDLFLDMSRWVRGVIAINGFVLSRYDAVGLQRTVYLPGSFLNRGRNEMLILEFVEPDLTLLLISRDGFDMKQHLMLTMFNSIEKLSCNYFVIVSEVSLYYFCNYYIKYL